MAIEGPLRELGIHDVFQLLDLSRKTGSLRVTSALRDNEGVVCFESGRVVSASIRTNPHPFGAMLVRAGKISEGDLERARVGAGAANGRQAARRVARRGGVPDVARARAAGAPPDRDGRVRAHVVAGRFLLVRRRAGVRRVDRSGGAHLDRVAAHGRRAPHRRVGAHRAQDSAPRPSSRCSRRSTRTIRRCSTCCRTSGRCWR